MNFFSSKGFARRKLPHGVLLLTAALASACGGGDDKKAKVVKEESPADEILRLSSTWTSESKSKGILSAPAKVSVFRERITMTLHLTAKGGDAELLVEEEAELRAGPMVRCATRAQLPLQVRYGRRDGEPAVEISTAATSLHRMCDGAHPEPTREIEASRTLLRLESDTLRVIEPKVDRRVFLPASE